MEKRETEVWEKICRTLSKHGIYTWPSSRKCVLPRWHFGVSGQQSPEISGFLLRHVNPSGHSPNPFTVQRWPFDLTLLGQSRYFDDWRCTELPSSDEQHTKKPGTELQNTRVKNFSPYRNWNGFIPWLSDAVIRPIYSWHYSFWSTPKLKNALNKETRHPLPPSPLQEWSSAAKPQDEMNTLWI